MAERTRELARSVNELKVLEEVGRAVAPSLDLDAVLPTVAARALELTRSEPEKRFLARRMAQL